MQIANMAGKYLKVVVKNFGGPIEEPGSNGREGLRDTDVRTERDAEDNSERKYQNEDQESRQNFPTDSSTSVDIHEKSDHQTNGSDWRLGNRQRRIEDSGEQRHKEQAPPRFAFCVQIETKRNQD